jgi:hypothetical protein
MFMRHHTARLTAETAWADASMEQLCVPCRGGTVVQSAKRRDLALVHEDLG